MSNVPTRSFVPTLDLATYIGQVSSTFTFELVDGITGERFGEINPLKDAPPTISHDTSRTIKRQLSPLNLGVEDARRIDPIRQRVITSMTMKGVDYPLGRYMFADTTAMKWTSGNLLSASLVDEMFIIDQELEQSFTVDERVDETVEHAIRRLLSGFISAGTFSIQIEGSTAQATGSWAAGTSRAKALSALCTQGGYFQPWFDNAGALRIIQSFEPADSIPDFDFDVGNQVIRGSIAETNDLLSAPNRFIVISNGSSGGAASAPAVGVYDVPNIAPHSILNRGFVIPDVYDIQVRDSYAAQAAAETIGISQTIFERTDLATPPDPRHDSYDVIRWNGEQWLELSWSLTMKEGAPMRHIMRKAYS